mmetsp:Transcript_37595/g.67023  ORF Transcript_37595/g.67023 Transcript_37595/m.67023 type:complete len:122 (-) Transcript_37595:895-1260(-)
MVPSHLKKISPTASYFLTAPSQEHGTATTPVPLVPTEHKTTSKSKIPALNPRKSQPPIPAPSPSKGVTNPGEVEYCGESPFFPRARHQYDCAEAFSCSLMKSQYSASSGRASSSSPSEPLA